MYHEHELMCPYCGEMITVFVDVSQGNQQTIEDCSVCCRPIELIIESDGNTLLDLRAFTSDETAY